jgi:hypothetical protein
MGWARHSPVLARDVKDRSGGRDTTGLKKDEYGITASQGELAHEHRADEPHRPSATANPRGAMFACEVYHLRYVRRHRYAIPAIPMNSNMYLNVSFGSRPDEGREKDGSPALSSSS